MNETLKRYMDRVHIEHTNGMCGTCLREQIKVEVAKEMLHDLHFSFAKYMKEVNIRWRATPIYKEVKTLQKKGATLEHIQNALKVKGYII